ncbi:DUF7402 domain-containing protein [Treponema zioleckii]|uniref:DUF7402 domain-containing protein n=1 Tax=Treponema zioleckii TaxID=331680 RepID=UPI00168AA0B8|nr:carbohydrate-binding protein [Treponema zioleckii]
MKLKLSILDKDGNVKNSFSAENELFAVYEGEYVDGDRISLNCDERAFVKIKLDDCMEESFCFLSASYDFEIPFGEKKMSYDPKSFTGSRHYLYVRLATDSEIKAEKNLALNPYDFHSNESLFPHAWANVETRGEAVFAARNAIDGLLANTYHGEWPYSSWGINRNPDAEFHLDFGRPVKINSVAIYLRADFPHDAWWTEGTLDFSDGSTLKIPLEKRGDAQIFSFDEKIVTSLTFYKLIKADDPSPFPALTQIKVFGRDLD